VRAGARVPRDGAREKRAGGGFEIKRTSTINTRFAGETCQSVHVILIRVYFVYGSRVKTFRVRGRVRFVRRRQRVNSLGAPQP